MTDLLVPFCLGPTLPLNLIGIDWIQKVANRPSVYSSMEDPHKALALPALTPPEGRLITSPVPR